MAKRKRVRTWAQWQAEIARNRSTRFRTWVRNGYLEIEADELAGTGLATRSNVARRMMRARLRLIRSMKDAGMTGREVRTELELILARGSQDPFDWIEDAYGG